jgi:hypothetical protein
MGVVPGFDKVGDGHSCPGLDREPASVEAFTFLRDEATPARGTIRAIPRPIPQPASGGPHTSHLSEIRPAPVRHGAGASRKRPGGDQDPLHQCPIGHQSIVTHSLITIGLGNPAMGCSCAPTLRTAPQGSFRGGHRFGGHASANPGGQGRCASFSRGCSVHEKGSAPK